MRAYSGFHTTRFNDTQSGNPLNLLLRMPTQASPAHSAGTQRLRQRCIIQLTNPIAYVGTFERCHNIYNRNHTAFRTANIAIIPLIANPTTLHLVTSVIPSHKMQFRLLLHDIHIPFPFPLLQ